MCRKAVRAVAVELAPAGLVDGVGVGEDALRDGIANAFRLSQHVVEGAGQELIPTVAPVLQ